MTTLSQQNADSFKLALSNMKRVSGKAAFDMMPNDLPFTEAAAILLSELHKRGFSVNQVNRALNHFWILADK
jgi:hypothetical protein